MTALIVPFTVPPRPRTIFSNFLMHRLVAKASELTAIDEERIRRPHGTWDIVWTRYAVIAVCHECGRTLGQLGAYFGYSDHTAAWNAVHRAAELEANNPEFGKLVRLLRKEASR